MDRVAIYYRVSTDKQDLASQRHDVEAWLAQQPKKPSKILEFKDEAWSGKNNNRPDFQRMMQMAISHQIDTIIVYRLDRFSRDANMAIRNILELDQHGVAFVSVSQPMLNLGHEMPFRRTILAAFAEIAELERDTIVGRVKSGLAAARKRGVRLGPPVKLTSEKRAEAVRLKGEGMSFKEIARRLSLSTGSVHTLLNPAPRPDLAAGPGPAAESVPREAAEGESLALKRAGGAE